MLIFPRMNVEKCGHPNYLRLDYNRGRPHSSLGPGIPDTDAALPAVEESRHVIPRDQRVVTKSVLGGLHHEYRLERIAA